MSTMEKFDLVVVGGGPGGYVAAIRAAQLGLAVALVEEKSLGGICLNWGCIPTKALLKGAEVGQTLRKAHNFGFEISDWNFDIARLVKHSREVSAQLSSGIEYLMRKNGVKVYAARARIESKGRLQLSLNNGDSLRLAAPHIVLATGARPRPLPGIMPDGEHIWTYFEALVPKEVPESLLIVGSGAIGLEFASFYADLGCRVTVVEAMQSCLPNEDASVAAEVTRSLSSRGVTFHSSTRLTSASVVGDSVVCELAGPSDAFSQLTVDKVLIAAGVIGNVEDLGLENIGLEPSNGMIPVDEWCRTPVVGFYAIGDVAGGPCLAHKASHEAVLCIEALTGTDGMKPLNKTFIPRCTYCHPQIASMGLTEDGAKKSGRSVRVGHFQLRANGRALASGVADGFVKVIFDAESDELLGAHMVGADVTEQLQGFGIAHTLEATAHDLVHTVFAHPTVSEAMHEAVLDAAGIALHA